MLSKRGNRGQRSRRPPVSLSVNSSTHVSKHTKQRKSSHLPTPTDQRCRSSRPASPRVCGWLVVVYLMCHRNFTRFPTGTWVLQIRQKMRQNCMMPSLRCQSAAKQGVDIRLCHKTLRAQHNRTNANDETLTLASKEHVGGACVWVEKPSHDQRKRRRRSKRFTREENSTHVECAS